MTASLAPPHSSPRAACAKDAPLCSTRQSSTFRAVLTHPKLVPYYTALCGEGYRMDHQPLVIAQGADSEGSASGSVALPLCTVAPPLVRFMPDLAGFTLYMVTIIEIYSVRPARSTQRIGTSFPRSDRATVP
jgi:hypothetical protein